MPCSAKGSRAPEALPSEAMRTHDIGGADERTRCGYGLDHRVARLIRLDRLDPHDQSALLELGARDVDAHACDVRHDELLGARRDHQRHGTAPRQAGAREGFWERTVPSGSISNRRSTVETPSPAWASLVAQRPPGFPTTSGTTIPMPEMYHVAARSRGQERSTAKAIAMSVRETSGRRGGALARTSGAVRLISIGSSGVLSDSLVLLSVSSMSTSVVCRTALRGGTSLAIVLACSDVRPERSSLHAEIRLPLHQLRS
jgi:hypothetical protein